MKLRLVRGSSILALALLAIPASARADDRPGDEPMILTISAQQKVEDLLLAYTKLTGTAVYWDPSDKAITTRKITGASEIRGTRAQFLDALRGLLAFQEVVLIPMGAPPNEYFAAMDARALQSQFILKMKAVPVELTDANLAQYEKRDGLFVSAVIQVQNLDGLRDARTALQRLITQNNIGSVQEIPAARAFLVTDFAPNVALIYRAIRRMDVVPAGRAEQTEFFDLKHARAQNVGRVLEELFGNGRKPAQPQSPAELSPSDVRISADGESNQVVVIASEEKIRAMRPIVAQLDRPSAK